MPNTNPVHGQRAILLVFRFVLLTLAGCVLWLHSNSPGTLAAQPPKPQQTPRVFQRVFNWGARPMTPGTGAAARIHTVGRLLGNVGPMISPGPALNQAAQSFDIIQTPYVHVDDLKQANPAVKTMTYTGPNRLITGEPVLAYLPEKGYAHCNGARLTGYYSGLQMWQIDPHTQEAITAMTREFKGRIGGKEDYVFSDDTVAPTGMQCMPDNYNAVDWAIATANYLNAAASGASTQIFYNGALRPQYADYLQAQPLIVGGSIENCFNDNQSANPPGPYVFGSLWAGVAQAFLRMQNYPHKQMTLCHGNDAEPASSASDIRIYTLASFLMFYDFDTTFQWNKFVTPSHVTSEPESAVVALHPIRAVNSVSDARCGGGYCREYNDCYMGGTPVGYCAVEVNPIWGSAQSVTLSRTYTRTLTVSGAGVVSILGDNGTATLIPGKPPASLCSPSVSNRASIIGCQTAAIVFQ